MLIPAEMRVEQKIEQRSKTDTTRRKVIEIDEERLREEKGTSA